MSLADAIAQLRDDLREAVLEGQDQEIVFSPKQIELELTFTIGTEVKVGGGVKLLAFLDLSGEGKTSEGGQHKIKLSLDVTDREGKNLKVRSTTIPKGI